MIEFALTTGRLALDYLRRLVADLDDDQMVTQPDGVPNHPAWTLGHLTCSLHLLGGEFGLEPEPPRGWTAKFLTGSEPVSDGDAYPDKGELLSALNAAQARLAEHLRWLGPKTLTSELPDETYRKYLPAKGHALLHILIGHVSVHVGQLTVWRRCMGLEVPPEMVVSQPA